MSLSFHNSYAISMQRHPDFFKNVLFASCFDDSNGQPGTSETKTYFLLSPSC